MEHQIDWTALRLTEPNGKEQSYYGIRFIHYPKTKESAQQILLLDHNLKLVRTNGDWATRSQRVRAGDWAARGQRVGR